MLAVVEAMFDTNERLCRQVRRRRLSPFSTVECKVIGNIDWKVEWFYKQFYEKYSYH